MSEDPHAPVKAAPIVLESAWSMPEALRVVVRNCRDQLLANAGDAARSRNVEFLHQTRVALRRMRSALRLLKSDDEAVLALRAELRWLAGELGPAREWDVLLEDTLPPILGEYAKTGGTEADTQTTRMLSGARRRRAQARKAACAAIGSERYAAISKRLENWLSAPLPPILPTGALTQFAAREVRKRHNRLLRNAEGFMQQTPEQRHDIRLDTKRLRYAAEFFGSLFAGKVVKRYLRDLTDLQDALGALNDAAAAMQLLEGLPGANGPAPFIRGWLAAREADSLASARKALIRMSRSERFWKSANGHNKQA